MVKRVTHNLYLKKVYNLLLGVEPHLVQTQF